MATEAAPLARWTCEACGECAVAWDAAWVEHARSTHRCPTPERERAAARITLALHEEMALRGLLDG